MPTALIIDHGASRAALAGARALAAAGWRVHIGSPSPATIASASRSVARVRHVPGPEGGLDPFVAAIAGAVAEDGVELVLPSDDHQLLGLSMRRADVGALVPYAPHDVVVRATDKLELHGAAERVGLGSPSTAEATDGQIARWSWPAMVKPRLHFPMVRQDAPAHLPVRRVSSRAQALEAAAEIRRAGGEPLIQEPIDGAHMSVTAVADSGGRVVACLQQCTPRLYPATAGISARAYTLPVDAHLLGKIERLLAELGWMGLVQLQFRARRGDAPRLIDFNGRLYGSLALGLHAGVNLPAAWADVARGRPVTGQVRGRAGARYQWFEGDLRGALDDGVGVPRSVVGALAFAARSGHSMWDPRDPGPAMRVTLDIARRAVRRRRGARNSG
jgi:predicted ATP-grasp superfamily ATP-dependent carboligase